MRARANAQVVAKFPVVGVVLALVAAACVGGHLVALQPGLRGVLGDVVEHGVGLVVRRHGGWVLGEPGVGLDGQVVHRQVWRRQGQRGTQVGVQFGQRLAGQRVHEVEVEGLEGLLRLLHRRNGLGTVVHAAQGLQVRVVEALHTNRQTGDARCAKGAEAVFLEGAGVGLQRHFAARRQRQARADVGQQAVDGRGRKQAGRAATNEDAVHLAPPHQRQRGFQVGAQGVQVALLGQGLAALVGVRIEIAVRALAQAPGDVHVQRQRRQAAEL